MRPETMAPLCCLLCRVAIPVTAMEPGRTYDRWFAVRRPAKAGRSSARRHMSQDAVSLQVAGGEPGGGDAADDDRCLCDARRPFT